MLRVANIEFLYLLLLIPAILIIFLLDERWKARTGKRFVSKRLRSVLIPDMSTWKSWLKFVLISTAYFFFVIALSNPQVGSKLEEVKRKGVDLMICLDLSNSMRAEDLKPNRLENAKLAISRLLDKIRNDRIGIVVFGGEAYVQLPITTDYAAAKLFLSTIDTDIIPIQGTAIGKAVELAESSFDMESPTSKAIIVITDGENHEDDAIEAAKAASQNDIVVHTIGMGSAKGAPIPIYRNGKNIGYLKDREGNSIVTKLDQSMLEEIARAGDGIFVRANASSAGLDMVFSEVERMEQADFGTKIYTDYEDRFQYFIGAGLLFIILEMLVFPRRNRFMSNLNLFGESK